MKQHKNAQLRKIALPALLFLVISIVLFLGFLNVNIAAEHTISGKLSKGYRIVTIPAQTTMSEFTVYRGDYLKFQTPKKISGISIQIPSLSVNTKLSGNLDADPYFKMMNIGRHAFTLGQTSGYLNIIEYDEPQYQALSIEETAQLITNISPVILDVRSRFEYANGHLQNARVVPLQEFQERLGELSRYRDENILVYCSTGNRSTVAAKILIDNGFTRIYNMREGVQMWTRQDYPIVH